jgi:6-phosphogluconolactonase
MNLNQVTRRSFLRLSALAAFGTAAGKQLTMHSNNEVKFYVGTYTTGRSEGIYLCQLNLETGELRLLDAFRGISNPSFLTLDSEGQHLFAVNETDTYEGQPSGSISAFKINAATSGLELINQKPTRGASPCYVTVDRTNQNLLVANYSGGSAAVLPFHNEKLGDRVALVQHHGSSINPDRQQEPHVHCVVLDKANRFAFVTDLGLDQIKIYKFNSRSGSLTPNIQPYVSVKPGAGPRHFAFHPTERWAYVINELDSTITAFNYQPSTGRLREFQNIPTLPGSFSGKSYCADIHISPSGKFLYGSNRGHDSIAVFTINEEHGFLYPVEYVPTGGSWPRNFALDPTGRFLLVANQKSDNIVSYAINEGDGRLRPTGRSVDVPTPVCIKFL